MTSTALGYQMMVEEKLLYAMIAAEQRLDFYSASRYAYIHAKFLHIENIASKPMPKDGSIQSNHLTWQTYYFNLLEQIATQQSNTLEIVRASYSKKGRKIPQ